MAEREKREKNPQWKWKTKKPTVRGPRGSRHLESCSLFDRASLSFHASHSRVHTCTPRSILLSSGSTGIPPQLERAFISLARRKRERERERSWPGLIEIMLIKSRRGEKNNEDLVENQSVTRADS